MSSSVSFTCTNDRRHKPLVIAEFRQSDGNWSEVVNRRPRQLEWSKGDEFESWVDATEELQAVVTSRLYRFKCRKCRRNPQLNGDHLLKLLEELSRDTPEDGTATQDLSLLNRL